MKLNISAFQINFAYQFVGFFIRRQELHWVFKEPLGIYDKYVSSSFWSIVMQSWKNCMTALKFQNLTIGKQLYHAFMKFLLYIHV